jgi:hypothetical protein
MYKAIVSFWSKSSLDQTQPSHESTLDEESWVFVSNTDSPTMTNSWIASPPLIKTEESSMNVHHFNPIENLLIEHASMSVYEQIASKARHRRQRKIMNDNKLDEHTEEDEEEDDDDDDKESINRQSSIHHRNTNQSPNSSVTTLESSTSSLAAHHRHLQRLHQRRKRSKLISTNNIGEPKPVLTKNLDRQRLLTPKALLQQPSRSNH